MEITASRFKFRANAPKGRKAISYQTGKRFPIRHMPREYALRVAHRIAENLRAQGA